MPSELATLGGGCYWCIEAPLLQLQGVESAVSGYAGGAGANPSYEAVCSGMTGHAEVVQVAFDPAVLSYHDLLEIFFTIHDPTSLNRQGADSGTQYRSVVFYHSEAQRSTAQAVMKEIATAWERPIVTELSAAPPFYPAESYHQDYFRRNPGKSYCVGVVAPKVAKVRAKYAARLRSPA